MKKIMVPIFAFLVLTLVTPAFAQLPTAPVFVSMRGNVTSYGAKGAFGYCGVLAEINVTAHAFLAWIPFGGPAIPEIYNFYAAELANGTAVKLNFEAQDLYIQGLWNVYNVTFIYQPGQTQGNYSLTKELLVNQGPGSLSVTGNWTDFAVNILSISLVQGNVTFHAISGVRIPPGDVTGPNGKPDRKIDVYDLALVARAYGSTPSQTSLYQFGLDFNFDFTIDIYDVTTVAASLGTTY
jgi:hypothetical protein